MGNYGFSDFDEARELSSCLWHEAAEQLLTVQEPDCGIYTISKEEFDKKEEARNIKIRRETSIDDDDTVIRKIKTPQPRKPHSDDKKDDAGERKDVVDYDDCKQFWIRSCFLPP